MVEMPDVAVRESRERIKSALLNSGFGYLNLNKTLTINMAPACREGAGFDLPVAIGILGAMGVVRGLDRHLLMGELSMAPSSPYASRFRWRFARGTGASPTLSCPPRTPRRPQLWTGSVFTGCSTGRKSWR